MRPIRHPTHPTHATHPVALRVQGVRVPPAITLASGGVQTIAQPIVAGQAVSAVFPAGVESLANYQAASGTIVSAVREASVAGGAFSATLTATPPAGALVAIRTRVTDSLGNVRFFPTTAGSFTAVGFAPPDIWPADGWALRLVDDAVQQPPGVWPDDGWALRLVDDAVQQPPDIWPDDGWSLRLEET